MNQLLVVVCAAVIGSSLATIIVYGGALLHEFYLYVQDKLIRRSLRKRGHIN